jgi:hypothetical protein
MDEPAAREGKLPTVILAYVKQSGIAINLLGRVYVMAMQLFVGDDRTMVAASVQCDVDYAALAQLAGL